MAGEGMGGMESQLIIASVNDEAYSHCHPKTFCFSLFISSLVGLICRADVFSCFSTKLDES